LGRELETVPEKSQGRTSLLTSQGRIALFWESLRCAFNLERDLPEITGSALHQARSAKTTVAVGDEPARNPRTGREKRKSRVAASQPREPHALLRRYAALLVLI